MASNSFGDLFRFTTWGESHGPAIGVTIDGCPSQIPLKVEDFHATLKRRSTGQSAHVSQRKEADEVRILSGVFEDMTTGTPIQLMIENGDMRSKDYDDIKDKFRPGHADYTYLAKYGIRDYRGGGRASARETASRTMAGVVAAKILGPDIAIRGALVQIGPHKINRAAWDWAAVGQNIFSCPDVDMVPKWEEYLDGIRKAGLSTGAVIEIVASGVPVGWGDPIYDKLDAKLANAMMSLNAVKGVEIGDGFSSASLTGDQNADEMRMGEDGEPMFLSNHAGGILGGISTGQDIVIRFAVKPTSSILVPRQTIDRFGHNTTVVTKGRHDPCVGIRAVPVGEAMTACVLADAMLKQRTTSHE